MVEFCREHGIPHQICGKVIVATHEEEFPRLEELRRRGEANGLTGLRSIGPEELREIEPHVSGLRALVVPSTGITDYAAVCNKYAEIIADRGETILTSAEVTGIKRRGDEITVETSRGAFSANSSHQLRGTVQRPRCSHGGGRSAGNDCSLSRASTTI